MRALISLVVAAAVAAAATPARAQRRPARPRPGPAAPAPTTPAPTGPAPAPAPEAADEQPGETPPAPSGDAGDAGGPPSPLGPPGTTAPPTQAPAPTVERIQFRGNRKVEDDAIRVNLTTTVGARLDREKIAADLRALWKMGFFDDIRVEGEATPRGGLILTFVFTEKPSVRRIYVSGNDDLDLDKLNEVIDLKRNTILDVAKVKVNVEKVRELYVSKGFYLATVDYQVRPVNETEVDVWLLVKENAKVQIRRVSFSGNQKVADSQLRSIMATQTGGFLSFLTDSGTYQEDVFERDLALITAYYYDHGFINVKVGTPQITLSADKRFMYIHIPIDEGPTFKIGKIDVRGDLMGPKSQYLARLETKPGQLFSRSRLGKDMVRLNDHYKDRGYAYVNVSPVHAIHMETRTVDLVFEIERGAKVYFERINIRGNGKTQDKVIRREMKIAEGELYSQTNLDISRARIQALGFFEKVDVSTTRGSTDEFIEVNVEVAERATGTFQIGAGFSSVENFIAQAQVSQNNLFGRGQTLALQAQLSRLRQLFSLRFIDPYFLDTNWTFAISLYNLVQGQVGFARTATGGDLTWGYPLSYESRAFLTYKLEQVGINLGSSSVFSGGVSSRASEVANLYRGGLTSSLRASANYDSRDNRLFPTKGYYHNGFVEVADRFTGSENVFVRWGGFARYYRPIYGPFVLKLNAELGVVTSRLPEGVPITERYLVGGITDIRGFTPRSLGPRINVQGGGEPGALFQIPLGGNMQLIWNSEIEFPLFQRVGISGVVFFDAGNAWNLEDKWCSRDVTGSIAIAAERDPCFDFPNSMIAGIRQSVGFGFRWFSPLGPLRFEWGIPLDRLPDERPLVFEFTIGNFF